MTKLFNFQQLVDHTEFSQLNLKCWKNFVWYNKSSKGILHLASFVYATDMFLCPE